MEEVIKIMDEDTLLRISYDDMVKYHGRFNIGGVAIAYKAIRLGFAKLSPDRIPSRNETAFFSGMSGSGVLDGAEMVLRARTRGTLAVDPALGANAAIAGGCRGRFYFELFVGRDKISLALKSGFITDEFTALAKGFNEGKLSPEQLKRLQIVKENLAAVLMRTPEEDVFDIVECCRS